AMRSRKLCGMPRTTRNQRAIREIEATPEAHMTDTLERREAIKQALFDVALADVHENGAASRFGYLVKADFEKLADAVHAARDILALATTPAPREMGEQTVVGIIERKNATILAMEADLAELRGALHKAAHRFDYCAQMIDRGFNISGTLRLEHAEKAKHFAL